MKISNANASVLSRTRIGAISFHAENGGNSLIDSGKRSSDPQYLSVAIISWQIFQPVCWKVWKDRPGHRRYRKNCKPWSALAIRVFYWFYKRFSNLINAYYQEWNTCRLHIHNTGPSRTVGIRDCPWRGCVWRLWRITRPVKNHYPAWYPGLDRMISSIMRRPVWRSLSQHRARKVRPQANLPQERTIKPR